MSKYLSMVWIVGLLCVSGLQAQTGSAPLPGGRDSSAVLQELIEQALEKNPMIKSAERRWRAAEQRVTRVSSLDDPVLSYTRWASSIETRVGPQENVLMLSQSFPFFGKLRLKGKMAREDAAAAGQHYQATRRDIVYKVKQAYFDLYWIDTSLRILDEYQPLLHQFRQVAERKYSTGVGIQANVLKADVEISSIDARRFTFHRLRQGTVARLNALLNRHADTAVEPVVVLDTIRLRYSEQQVRRRALDSREELKAAEAIVRRFDYGVRLARRNYWPDFRLSGTLVTIPSGKTLAPDNGKDAWSIRVGVNLPIWLGKRRAAVEEARALRTASSESYAGLKNEIVAEIRDLYAAVETSRQTVDLYARQLLPDAENALRSALSSYQTGNLDFLSLLDSERLLLNFRLAYAREIANYRKQIAALERAAGGELP